MRAFVSSLLAALLLLTPLARAEPPADMRSPKSENPRLLRIFLYVAGSDRLIDYPDVEKIICCEKEQITFETQDGHVVLHRGPFTIIQPRNATATTVDGTKFFDVK